MNKRLVLLLLLLGLGLAGCYYDSEEHLYPHVGVVVCDTTKTAFSGDIYPIISNSCNGCHSDASSGSLGGGISLEGYANVQSVASSGQLKGVITHSAGYSAMPKGSAKLSDCKITQITKWIDNGILNN